MRGYFSELDDDGSGAIGVDELEDPLIALGLVDSRQEVDKIVQEVDDDGTGMIEFGEFLSIIKGGSKNKSDDTDKKDNSAAIKHFLRILLFISGMRRRHILAAILRNSKTDQKEGEKILNNYKKALAERFAREADEKDELFSRPSGS